MPLIISKNLFFIRALLRPITRPIRQAYKTIKIINLKTGNEYSPSKQEIDKQIDLHETVLLGSILPYWFPYAIDGEFGGYQTNRDKDGQWIGKPDKLAMAQARILWFFSYLSLTRYGTHEHVEAANVGFRFLEKYMWDVENGGFYSVVSQDGRQIINGEKHLVNQAFCLNALGVYFQLTGNQDAKNLADQLFVVIEEHAHDKHHGGYIESLTREWKSHSIFHTNFMLDGEYRKTMSTQMHLMDALNRYYQISGNPLAKDRLYELILIMSNTVNYWGEAGSVRRFRHDWLPLHRGPEGEHYYDHDLENIWMLLEAVKSVGIPESLVLHYCRNLFDNALKNGFDQEKGGVFFPIITGGHNGRKGKEGWAQAESLVGSLAMYQLTREQKYWQTYRSTFDWIINNQINWETGEWYAYVTESGVKEREKPQAIKSPFHNGRAMLKCLEIFSQI